ncbi:O-antigen ligase family protein [Thioalkalivibrio sulfidiphilus]|uniref:O-antigen ligase family protein n=1 Tax=Thioalkalivibrio sulfidiphilus TaxID=1033854 RepID=UPI00039C500B|nr:O-antigen ligase family protein [Thioalkalivibrio sulfidiphilus]
MRKRVRDSINVNDDLTDVYRLRIGAIWQRLKAEPLYFWFFCGYIFFEYVRPQSIYPAISIIPWMPILLLGALFLFIVDGRASKSLSGPLTFPVLGFFIVAFLSIPFAYDPSVSIEQVDVLINWVLVYLLFIWIVDSRFRFFVIFLILLLASFKMAQHGFRVGLSRGFAFERWGVGGPPGWFQNAADLGVQMIIYTAWSIAFYFGLKNSWNSKILKWIGLFFIVSGFGAALATGQRNTVLAFVAMAIALVIFSKRRILNLFLILLVTLGAYSLSSQEFRDRFVNAGESDTAQSRLHFWRQGISFYADNPVIGVGYNNWIVYYAAYGVDDDIHGGNVMVAHSAPITVAAELGSLGLFFYHLVILVTILVNIRTARLFAGLDPPFWRLVALSLSYGLIGYVVASAFLSVSYYPFLWVHAALSASLYRIAVYCKESLRPGHGMSKLASNTRATTPLYRKPSK